MAFEGDVADQRGEPLTIEKERLVFEVVVLVFFYLEAMMVAVLMP